MTDTKTDEQKVNESNSVSKSANAKNRFYIHGTIGAETVRSLEDDLVTAITEQSKLRNGKITLFIQSLGGSWYAGCTILSLIDLAKSKDVIVETVATGLVYSMASIIAVNGTQGHRYINSRAEHGIHFGSTGVWGSSPLELDRSSKEGQRFFKMILKQYLDNCKIPDIEKKMSAADQYTITSVQALKWGVADYDMSQLDLG